MAKFKKAELDDDQLNALMSGDDEAEGEGKPKRKYTRRSKQESTIDIKGEQVAIVTSGLLAALEGITRMPFKEVDTDVKKSFDDSLAVCASVYGGEYVAKYLPLIQLGLSASLIVSTTYQKHLQNQKQKIEHAEET